jgi:hypothetical protein
VTELRAGLGVSDNPARIIVGGIGDQPCAWPLIWPSISGLQGKLRPGWQRQLRQLRQLAKTDCQSLQSETTIPDQVTQ